MSPRIRKKKGKKRGPGKKGATAGSGGGPESLLARASALQSQGRLEEAAGLFRQVVEQFPELPVRHQVANALGAIYLALGRLDEAARALDAAAKDLKGRPYLPAICNLALVHLHQGRFEEAASECRKVLALEPRNARAWNSLALALKEEGSLVQAADAARRAVELAPGWPEAWNNLGVILELMDRVQEAEAAFKEAADLRPGYIAPLYNLGCLYHRLDRFEESASVLKRVLELEEGHSGARFLLQTLGELPQPESAPSGFVKDTFNTYAGVFEEKLKNELGYRTPEELFQELRPLLEKAGSGLSILDLGCGTGLGAEYYRPFAGHLAGMDCAERMLEKAQEKGIYDRLFCHDILEPWPEELSGLDLIYSSDCLVYFGDLSLVFSQAAEALALGGLFGFSVELLKEGMEEGRHGWRLGRSGRFAHQTSYVEKALEQAGFETLTKKETALRREGGRAVRGMIFTARLTAERR